MIRAGQDRQNSAADDVGRWRLGPGVRWLDEATLAGGNPVRFVTMTGLGARHVQRLLAGTNAAPTTVVDGLFLRLEGAGFLVPPVAAPTHHDDVTLVVPALSTTAEVRKLLQHLPTSLRVVLVDDGSPESLVGLQCERKNLTVLRHDRPRGPAAARNIGAATVDTPWIAFLDADTRPDDDWIAALRAQIEQSNTTFPTSANRVVLAAPRIYPLPGPGLGGWFDQRVVALDLGSVASDIGIGRVVPYVPSAALLVDRESFEQVGGFDESMQVGEDVDLVWRLAEHGRLCYYPHVAVGHTPRSSLLAALNRRRVYGLGAADLSFRHPGAVRHLEASIWTLGPWMLAITINPLVGAAAAITAAAVAHSRLQKLSAAAHAHRFAARNHLRAAGMLGRWLMRPLLPLTLAVAAASPRLRPRLLTAVGAGLLYLVSLDLQNSREAPGPASARLRLAAESIFARTLDDAAYSVGVWQGVITRRNLDPVLPRLRGIPEKWTHSGRGH